MASLSVFPAPPSMGEVTLCEMNARLIAEDYSTAKLSKYVPATQGIKYPSIDVNKESAKTGNNLSSSIDPDWGSLVKKEKVFITSFLRFGIPKECLKCYKRSRKARMKFRHGFGI